MAKSKVSINDIASALNISKTTVSFILNGKAKEKRISDTLVEKVLQKVKELEYQPNHFAKSLRTGRTNIIGLMVEDISNPFYANIAKEIEDKAYQNNYKIVYCSTENNQERAREFLGMFTTLGVDGCIIAPTMGLENDIKKMVDQGMEVVLFDRRFRNVSNDVVMVNNEEGVYGGVQHLAKRGFKNITMIALALGDPEKEDRIRGFKEATSDFGLESRVFPLPFKHRYLEYVDELKSIIQNNPTDAIVFGTNYLGLSGLVAIKELGLKIPEDLGIISFDDHDLFRIHDPTITVIAQPIEDISQTVINTLLDRLKYKEENHTRKSISLATSLMVRESTRRVNT